jgi:hypothetical protein
MSKPSIISFIQQHRHAFDAAVPDAHGWQGLEQALNRLKTADSIERAILFDRLLLDADEPKTQVWDLIAAHLDTKDCVQLDDLECFIHSNRTGLDQAEPTPKVWTAIESAVASSAKTGPIQSIPPLRLTWSKILIRAAAAIALLVAGVGLGIWYSGAQQQREAMAMSDVSSEYAELERYYQQKINSDKQKLANFTGYRPTEVADDLQQMDQIMLELQQELANVPIGNREQVVRAMIENYETKASVLRRVLEQLEKNDSSTPEDTNHKQHEFENL